MLAHSEMKKTIHRAQHCQRNWDLTKEIPAEDMELLVEAITQCPSKQNIAFYKVHLITNRDVIEKVHLKTDGAVIKFDPWTSVTNSQTLANLLVVFEECDIRTETPGDINRNLDTRELAANAGHLSEGAAWNIDRDRNVAVGIAAGFLNVVANWMGYNTGCCSCYDEAGVMEVLGLKNRPILLMGVGFKNENEHRRRHHNDRSIIFPTKQKQQIEVNVIA